MSDIESIVRKHAESFDYGAFDGDDNLIKFSGNGLSNLIAEIRKEQAAKIEQLTKERDEALTRLSGQTYFVPPEISDAYQALQEDYNEQAAKIVELEDNFSAIKNVLHDTQAMVAILNAALKYYADGDHFMPADESQWDSCSGEPDNILWDSEGLAGVEDGYTAKQALSATEQDVAKFIAEIEAKALAKVRQLFYDYRSNESDELFITTVLTLLDELDK